MDLLEELKSKKNWAIDNFISTKELHNIAIKKGIKVEKRNQQVFYNKDILKKILRNS